MVLSPDSKNSQPIRLAFVHAGGKCGESEIRRLLFCAAQPARCYALFDNYYQQQLTKGLSKIAAKVILARKLARIAFTLLTNEQSFMKKEIAYS